MSIFLQFILDTQSKSISVSGKSFRIYSALRFEMMAFFINTHFAITGTAAAGSSGNNGKAPIDPLTLADNLCKRLVTDPVKEIVHDEEDGAIIRIFTGINKLLSFRYFHENKRNHISPPTN